MHSCPRDFIRGLNWFVVIPGLQEYWICTWESLYRGNVNSTMGTNILCAMNEDCV